MRLEHIPLIIGAIVALIGLAFIADGLMADTDKPTTERRRRMRAERSRAGETIVGIGILCMAAALIGRDTWRYGTVAVLTGGVLLLIGIILNRSFLREALFFRGPARRADPLTLDSPHPKRPASRSAPSSPRPAPPVDAARPAPRADAAPPTPRHESPPAGSPPERRKTPRGR